MVVAWNALALALALYPVALFLVCRLLNYACQAQIPLPTAETLLNTEISWLKKVRVSYSVNVDQKCCDILILYSLLCSLL